MESELIALVDLDGTLANFNKAIVGALNTTRSPLEEEFTDACLNNPPPWLDARMDYIKRRPGFWRDLETIPLGMEVLKLIREIYTVHILTKGPTRNPQAWSEKVEWVQKHVPDALITVTLDKGGSYGRLLFDDWPPYIERWMKWRPRGLVLMLDHPVNRNFNPPNVLRIRDESDFPAVTEALIKRAA